MFLLVIPTAIFVPKAHRTVEFSYYVIHTRVYNTDLEFAVGFTVYLFIHYVFIHFQATW